jgi:hypothetical protein
MKNAAIKILFLLVLPLLALAPFAIAENASMAAKHPMEVEVPVICSQCHTDWRASMDHSAEFGRLRHKFSALQHKQVCGICHKESFCADCHAHKEEIKPSDKFKDSPDRALPHRGDYLNQHKIDGRINPASCMKCHGRQNNERCRVCHK